MEDETAQSLCWTHAPRGPAGGATEGVAGDRAGGHVHLDGLQNALPLGLRPVPVVPLRLLDDRSDIGRRAPASWHPQQ